MKYPKIQTLFNRDKKTFRVIEEDIRCPEFLIPKHWHVFEKINGMNCRVIVSRSMEDEWNLRFSGRTDNAMMNPIWIKYLDDTFKLERLKEVFNKTPLGGEVTLYGELYGKKIQEGYIMNEIKFRAFDCYFGDDWWADPDYIKELCYLLGIEPVLKIGIMDLWEIIEYVKGEPRSIVAFDDSAIEDYPMEGIVARTIPMLLMRNKEKLLFKLKVKDFKGGKK